MKPSRLLLCLPVLCVFLALAHAEETKTPPPARQATKEEIEARLAEHARKKAMGSAVADTATVEEKKAAKSETGAPVEPPGTPADAKTANPPAATATPDAATVLPKLDVQKGKITELDRQLAKQNKEIAREKENTKPTRLDETLNGPKVSKALAFFGGQSSDDRANIAKERVAMMEDEKELIEAIAQTKDKAEKEELQKTLAAMKEMRRELENALR